MKPGSTKPADGRTSRQPSPSPLGRRPLGGEDRPSSASRPTTPIRGRATRPNSPAKVGDTAVKPRGLGMRSWLRINPNGDTQVIEADKYAIMRRCAIPARDLRILDPVLVYPSTILGREKAIVINLEHIKAIITAEEVLLQNYHNPYVEQFVVELQRRISSVRDPLTLDPNFCSPPPSLPHPSQPLEQTSASADPSPKQAPKHTPATDSVLLAPGLTASHGRSPSPTKKTTTNALKQQEHPSERGKSPLKRASPSKKPTSPSRPPPVRRNDQRWQSLARENSLRGRSWSPVRRGAARAPSPSGSTHSPERKMDRERVRSLSPLPRGRNPARQSPVRGGASRPLSPIVKSERSSALPSESSLWAPLAALKNRVFGRKKSYQRLQSPDSDGRHMSPLPSSQVLFLEGGDAPGGAGFLGQAGSAHVVLPFEFRALEVILETVCGHLDVKSMELEQEAYPALDDLTVKIISANLERVRRFKSRLVGLSVRVQKVRDELEGLLDDDGDMREMYLTDKMLDALEPVSPDSTFTAGGFGSVMAGGSPHMSVSDPSRSRRQSTGAASPSDQRAPGTSIQVPPPLDLSGSGPPVSGAPTPRLGPIQPSILDVGFGPEGTSSTGIAPQLSRELTFNPRAYEEHAATLAREGHLVGVGESGQRDAQAEVGMHGEADDQVSPLLRHFSGHSQRSLRRGRSRSRSRSGSRSRGSRSSTSRSSRSTKSSRKSGKGEDVEELEMLLEAYFAQIEGTLNKLSALREYIEDTEDYINIRLDDHQNQLLLLVIIITIGTVATTIAVVVSGVFGMNIQCSLYHDPKWFPVVMWSTLAACLACGIGIISWLKWRNLLSL